MVNRTIIHSVWHQNPERNIIFSLIEHEERRRRTPAHTQTHHYAHSHRLADSQLTNWRARGLPQGASATTEGCCQSGGEGSGRGTGTRVSTLQSLSNATLREPHWSIYVMYSLPILYDSGWVRSVLYSSYHNDNYCTYYKYNNGYWRNKVAA